MYVPRRTSPIYGCISMRFEVSYINSDLDGREGDVIHTIASISHGQSVRARIIDVYFVEGVDDLKAADLDGLFSDPVVQQIGTQPSGTSHGLSHDASPGEGSDVFEFAAEITYQPGVTDPVAITARKALEDLYAHKGSGLSGSCVVQTARQYRFFVDLDPDIDTHRTTIDSRVPGKVEVFSESDIRAISSALYNPLIQRETVITGADWSQGARFADTYSHNVRQSDLEIAIFDIVVMTDAELLEFSKRRLLALTLPEMQSIRDYYADPEIIADRTSRGITPLATDVELEMLAQTWSEHCKHKILNATIDYTEDGHTERIESLFKTYIRGTTKAVEDDCDYLRSVFHDDSGIIEFDDESLICFKVETHNSPSALDPYGGAITGIVGVNRDILGSGKGAKPIFNTNVLCFADPDTPSEDVPESLLHPTQVLRGVHKGIIDGGNQSGIPTVAGAFLFDESYLGKPLVFCGTGGILPAEIDGEGGWIKHIDPGDLAVMVGGRIGKDGIHGATFSSLALDESSPTSAVQIGDPITQKLMTDFLLEARDARLFRGITDNGAGGLSSSLGEMAEIAGGISIDLDACPLKYEGLAPWEILVSESQERMSLAVSTETIDDLLALARCRDVEATVVGAFTDSGFVEIRSNDAMVGLLSLKFLHDGLPTMILDAVWDPPARETGARLLTGVDRPSGAQRELTDDIFAVLSEPNVASKEPLVRQYDHEVQGGSVIKPFVGINADAPSDGAVLRPKPESYRGVTITHGVCPRVGDIDAYEMAKCAVDEAYRAHIALGGNPDLTSGLDNFCWSDPVLSEDNPNGRYKAAQLVRACRGLSEACIDFNIPLISGKDSMKNDARIDDRSISVRPTLLVSLMGIIDDVRRAMTTDFKRPGDLIYISGSTRGALAGSIFERVSGQLQQGCPTVETETALRRYRALSRCIDNGLVSSAHDCADGGLAVAVIESCIGDRFGAQIDLDAVPSVPRADHPAPDRTLLFDESPSRFIISIRPENRTRFESSMTNTDTSLIGTVSEDSIFTILRDKASIARIEVEVLTAAFKRQPVSVTAESEASS